MTLQAALANIRHLNDLAKRGADQVPDNPEYLRGQVELTADIYGLDKEEIYTRLGVKEL